MIPDSSSSVEFRHDPDNPGIMLITVSTDPDSDPIVLHIPTAQAQSYAQALPTYNEKPDPHEHS